MDIITPNEDRVITITLDNGTGGFTDPTLVLFLSVVIHQAGPPETIITRFVKEDMKNIVPLTGKFDLNFKREITKNLVAGIVFITMTWDLTGAGFTDSKKRNVTDNFILGEVIGSNVDKDIL